MKKHGLEAREQLTALEAVEWNDQDLRAKVVIIRPGVNLSGTREWKPAALKRAVESHFWDGTKMFLDHDIGKGHLPSKAVNRSIKDMVSAVESTELGPEGEVIGEVAFFDEKFYNFTRRAQKHIGPSVNLLFDGDVVKRNGRRFEVVESLEHSKSVDWVVEPGAGGAILEFIATEGEDDVEWSELTRDMLRENRPDLVEAIESAATPPPADPPPADPKDPPVAGLSKDDVKQMLREAREEWDGERRVEDTARDNYQKKVTASGLPQRTQTRLMSAFEGTYNEGVVDKAIQEAREELADAGVKPRVRGLGSSGSDGDGDSKTLAEVAPLHSAMESAFTHRKNTQEGAN